MRTSVLRPILLALLFALAGNAFGQIDTGPLYRITAKHSGKCLDVAGGPGATGNGVRVVQWDCNGAENQTWAFTPVGDDYYRIQAKHSGRALDVSGGIVSLGNGAVVNQWDYHGGSNQMWRLTRVEEGFYEIRARHSGKSLDINGGPGAMANGAQAQQWDYVGGDNQKFRLTALGTRPACAVTDPLTSTFTGRAELTTNNRDASGPYLSNINLTVEFTNCRANIGITAFPAIANTSDTRIGPNTSTITMTQGGFGTFDPSNGSIVIPITLGLENSQRLFGNSTLPLRLAAEGAPDAKNPDTGIVTLRGTGIFMGGALGGYEGTITVTGSFSPRPR